MIKITKKNETDESRFMTAEEVAKYLRVSLDTVYRYKKRGILTAATLSRKPLLFDREKVNQLLKEKEQESIDQARKEIGLS